MTNAKRYIRIVHRQSGAILAEGPIGWGITPFEGNYYISKRFLNKRAFKPNWIPGFCPYKFFYVWLDLNLGGSVERSIAWMYWLPNPLLPFIWFRVALPGAHPSLDIEVYQNQFVTHGDHQNASLSTTVAPSVTSHVRRAK